MAVMWEQALGGNRSTNPEQLESFEEGSRHETY